MKKALLTVAILCSLALIWGNSLLPGQISGALSQQVHTSALPVLEKLGIALPAEVSPAALIRKLAHFGEFSLLGFLLSALFLGLRRKGGFPTVLLLGLLAALSDETIQMFIPERSARVLDVWLDFVGFIFGALVYLSIHMFISFLCKEKQP